MSLFYKKGIFQEFYYSSADELTLGTKGSFWKETTAALPRFCQNVDFTIGKWYFVWVTYSETIYLRMLLEKISNRKEH